MIARRVFMTGSAAILLSPAIVPAQQSGRIARIGRLSPISASADGLVIEGFRQGLRDLGWVEGQNFTIETRVAEGNVSRLSDLATELVRSKVDVILAGSTPGVRAAKDATSAIPIVMVTTGDPVAHGLVASLARPGGNITGVTALAEELSGKRLEVLREAIPGITRVTHLSNPAYPDNAPSLRGVERAARALGVQVRVLDVTDPSQLDSAFATMSRDGTRALLVGTDIMFNTHRRRIVELAAKNRLPTMYGLREFMAVGGLMFYGASLPEMYRRAATHVDRILKGARPADLPVEQPTKFELVINVGAATALGLTIAPSVLLRADQVIQ